jgi:hypothetical protein
MQAHTVSARLLLYPLRRVLFYVSSLPRLNSANRPKQPSAFQAGGMQHRTASLALGYKRDAGAIALFVIQIPAHRN